MSEFRASLSLEQRVAHHRQFAAQAVLRAQGTFDPDQRAEYLNMASGWHAMALEAERYSARMIPSEGVKYYQIGATPDDRTEP